MNMRQIEGFCLLAKTLNFSKTAERMYITQPAFSRMIESLENELGCRLVIRDRVNPKLTSSGEKVLKHMERMYAEYNALIDTTREQVSDGGEITIGVMEAGLTEQVRDILKRFSAEYPAIRVSFREIAEIEVFDQLQAGGIDCAIVAHFPPMYHDRMTGHIIQQAKICAVLNAADPLAARSELYVRDLKNESFIIVDNEKSELGYNSIMSLCLDSGYSPRITRRENSITTALSAVDLNYGCMILTDNLKNLAGSDTVFIPLADAEPGAIWAVYNSSNTSPAIADLKSLLTE